MNVSSGMSVSDSSIDRNHLLLIIHVSRLDASQSKILKEEVDKIWTPSVEIVTIDLRDVIFVDSSGVGAMLGIYKRLPEGKGSVRLVNVQPAVQTVIELLRLHRVFEMPT